MTPARWQLFLSCREKALGREQQLMMVREPEFHGYQLAQAALNAAAQKLAAHVMRSRVAVPKRGIAPKGRRRR